MLTDNFRVSVRKLRTFCSLVCVKRMKFLPFRTGKFGGRWWGRQLYAKSDRGSPRVDSSQSRTAITSGFFSSKIKLSNLQQRKKTSYIITIIIFWRIPVLWRLLKRMPPILRDKVHAMNETKQTTDNNNNQFFYRSTNLKSPWTTVVESFAGTFSNSHAISLSIAGISCVLLASYCFAHLSVWRRM